MNKRTCQVNNVSANRGRRMGGVRGFSTQSKQPYVLKRFTAR